MPEGTTSEKCFVSPSFCRPLICQPGECRREYMDLAEFESRFRIVSTAARKDPRQLLSPVGKYLRRMQEELHFNLRVPGSSPGRASVYAVAQLVEHQTPVRGCCFSNFCRRKSLARRPSAISGAEFRGLDLSFAVDVPRDGSIGGPAWCRIYQSRRSAIAGIW